MSTPEEETPEPKWKMKYDSGEDCYIYYRKVSKSEAQNHLANYTSQKDILDTNMVLWAAVVDYEESKESKE